MRNRYKNLQKEYYIYISYLLGYYYHFVGIYYNRVIGIQDVWKEKQNVRIYLYKQRYKPKYKNLFIFRFVSAHYVYYTVLPEYAISLLIPFYPILSHFIPTLCR